MSEKTINSLSSFQIDIETKTSSKFKYVDAHFNEHTLLFRFQFSYISYKYTFSQTCTYRLASEDILHPSGLLWITAMMDGRAFGASWT